MLGREAAAIDPVDPIDPDLPCMISEAEEALASPPPSSSRR